MRLCPLLVVLLCLSSFAFAASSDEPFSTGEEAPVAGPVAPFDPYAPPVYVRTPAEADFAEEESRWGYAVAVIFVLLFCGLCTWDGYKNGCAQPAVFAFSTLNGPSQTSFVLFLDFIAPSYRGLCVEVRRRLLSLQPPSLF